MESDRRQSTTENALRAALLAAGLVLSLAGCASAGDEDPGPADIELSQPLPDPPLVAEPDVRIAE